MLSSSAPPLASSHSSNLLGLVGIEFLNMCLEGAEKWAEEWIGLVCKGSPGLLGLEDEIIYSADTPALLWWNSSEQINKS